MRIVYKESFVLRLERQIKYIAVNNPDNAIRFKNELIAKLKKILANPYVYRKSIYFKKDKVRDLVFKGYTIVFRIKNDRIEVFGITKYQNKPID